ncbi:MAG: LptF/LptG family permease, partial [Verrucomicrobiota bacterium]
MLLHWYIFRAVLVATIMSVAVFIFVLVAGNAIKEVLGLLASGRLDWGTFFYLMVVLIPRVLPNALPFGILTGVLLVMGRMSAQGEILAMKAAGISLYRIAAPIVLIAVGGTFLALGINFYYGPVADTLYKGTLRNVVRDDPLRFFQEKTFIKDFPGLVLYFQSRDGNKVIKPYIWVLGQNGMLDEFIKGETGTVTLDEDEDALLLTVFNASGERRGGDDAENLDEQYTAIAQEVAFRISLDGLFGSKQREKKLSHMTLNELLGERQRAIDNPDAWPEAQRLERQKSIQVTLQKKAAMAFAV